MKVVVTTRERSHFAPIRLEQLAEEAALELIEQQAEEKMVNLNRREAQMLYDRIGGIPVALVYAVGQRAAGYTLETVLRLVHDSEGDVARFCEALDWAQQARDGYERLGAKSEIYAMGRLIQELREQIKN